MSFDGGLALQNAIETLLAAHGPLATMAALREGASGDIEDFVIVGAGRVQERGPGLTEHRLEIGVHSRGESFAAVKAIAAEVTAALGDGRTLALETGRIIAFDFLRSQATRGRGADRRRIILTFRALIAAE